MPLLKPVDPLGDNTSTPRSSSQLPSTPKPTNHPIAMDPLTKFMNVCETLEDFARELDASPDTDHSEFTLHTYMEELKAVWMDLKNAFNDALEFLVAKASPLDNSDTTSSEIIVARSKQQRYFKLYVRLTAKIQEQLHLNAASTSRTTNTGLEASHRADEVTHSGYNISLPPCDTDVFKGDYESWPAFRDMFSALYIRNNRLSPVEKLFHLNQKTRGEAKEIVQKSPLVDSGFAQAWRNLTDRFENKRILVNSHLRTLFNLTPVIHESGAAIKRLQREINNTLGALDLLDIDVNSWDAIIVHLCSSRLPETTLSLWERSITQKREIPSWKEMDEFLTSHFQTLETVDDLRKSAPTPKRVTGSTARNAAPPKPVNTFQANMIAVNCPLCSDPSHPIRRCSRFLAMQPDKRWTTISNLKFCTNCLAHSHQLKDCKSAFTCMSCTKRHHTLLHREVATNTSSLTHANSQPSTSRSQPQPHRGNNTSTPSRHLPAPSRATLPPPQPQIQSTSNPPTSNVLTCFTSRPKQVLLATAMVHIRHRDELFPARALIDPGSEATFLTERVQQRLRLPTKIIQAQIASVNETVTVHVSKQCKFTLDSPKDPHLRIEATALVLPKLTGNLPVCSLDRTLFDSMPDLALADEQFYQSDQIDILIGADLYPFILLDGIKRNFSGSLIAQETIFGWIITGPIPQKSTYPVVTTRVSFFNEVSIDQQLSRFWDIEEVPQKPALTPAETFCENLYAATTQRRTDGRYVVRLPFKEGFPSQLQLGRSREIALKQFLRNESRLLKTPDFKNIYDNVIREYSELDHMVKVAPTETFPTPGNYYLPHHAVLKPESSSTKVRVVFNASCSTSNGLSLNDALYTGPPLQSDLTFLLLRWRLYRYVFNGDIEKMYRQILVHPEQSRYQRILFRNSPSEEVQDFELRTVTFGVNCAPYLAIRTLQQLAQDVEKTLPLASSALKYSMYVDDALCGSHELDSAIRMRHELVAALQSAAFTMRKWTANHPSLLSGIPPQDLLNSDFLELEDASSAKTLGIRWNASTDCFNLDAKLTEILPSYTKREMLSLIAKLFDPAGWLAPVIVVAKTLMQQVWLDGTSWDEPLNHHTLQRWLKFVQCYHQISLLKIPRWTHYTPASALEIHAFSDASELAYAGAVYLRTCTPTHTHTSLLYAKTRVAPIKTLSIPRLELCGAALLADMLNALLPQLNLPQYKLYCWTDSTIVLAWLKRPPCTWTTFVANRVTKIIEIADATHWFHVESQHNPADLASRGMFPLELRDTKLWWHGPEWLQKNERFWPHSDLHQSAETDLEAKPIKAHVARLPPYEDVLERFSSLPRALRVIAYIFRFHDHTHPQKRTQFLRNDPCIYSDEIRFVTARLIALTQRHQFADEYRCLERKSNLEPKSSILSLNPFLSGDGLLRVGGRLASCPSLAYDERHPIILPYNCQYSRLLIRFMHDITLHGGNSLMLRLLRTQYWIPKAKNLIKTTIHSCKPCILQKRQAQTQIMAALPPERTQISRPFAATGLDFAGPFDIKNYTGRACLITKGYVCVFVCFATKAIHLEAVSDLSTPAFLAAFNRFAARRGCPKDVYSDNGKNFVGASRSLAKDWTDFVNRSRNSIINQWAYQQLQWHFIPAAAPHMGGLWEAGVKSFKLHFRKFVGDQRFTFEELATILAKVEACLNSRLLSSMSENPSDLQPLTPGHFLIGGLILTPAEPELLTSPMKIVNRWQKLKAIYQHFCNRWKSEYLSELQRRSKWKTPQPDLQVNDLVVLRDDNLPPTQWRLGRVSRTYPGSDSRIRVADVRTEKGHITRPITKLILLSAHSQPSTNPYTFHLISDYYDMDPNSATSESPKQQPGETYRSYLLRTGLDAVKPLTKFEAKVPPRLTSNSTIGSADELDLLDELLGQPLPGRAPIATLDLSLTPSPPPSAPSSEGPTNNTSANVSAVSEALDVEMADAPNIAHLVAPVVLQDLDETESILSIRCASAAMRLEDHPQENLIPPTSSWNDGAPTKAATRPSRASAEWLDDVPSTSRNPPRAITPWRLPTPGRVPPVWASFPPERCFPPRQAARIINDLRRRRLSRDGSGKHPDRAPLAVSRSEARVCKLCDGLHALRACRQFLRQSAKRRWKTIRELNFCSNCLAFSHVDSDCHSPTTCRRCQERHHTLLHTDGSSLSLSVSSRSCVRASPAPSVVPPSPVPLTVALVPSRATITTSLAPLLQRVHILRPTALVRLHALGGFVYVRALLDSGCETSEISYAQVAALGLTPLRLGSDTVVMLQIRPRGDFPEPFTTHAVVSDWEITAPGSGIDPRIRSLYSNYKLADPDFHVPHPVRLRLGPEALAKIYQPGILNLYGHPFAQNSVFGWVISGTIPT